jgi:RHH-type proline utilization regulon transcriptional repressor/proline dehydrogenase/delta 1-pyrroline-5-carboxylate dehydrogenase
MTSNLPSISDPSPFALLAGSVHAVDPMRATIAAATRRPEPDCLPPLLTEASFPPELTDRAQALARRLVLALRGKGGGGGVEGLIQEFSLSSQEGIALLCLAEALLRIPDSATRDALIRDKLAGGDWRAHLGQSASLFVNAATWGLLVTGHLVCPASESGLSSALTRLLAKGGEPLIRKAVDMMMRLLGEQFVAGQTIQQALHHARPWQAKGFRYSYDMLGEAALTASDVDAYFADYRDAIRAIGESADGRGVIRGPGISVKLSALHPRYVRSQRQRVMLELWPRLQALAHLAQTYDIGLNIDAEEADRLDLSLDLLEMLCEDPTLAGWQGIGFVLQAYQKRAPLVLDFLIALARRSGHRLMLRLVKGAYWDAEIKRAQQDGLEGFPVYTRKIYTDVCYLACARRMLAAPDAIFSQFATHNAQTLATLYQLAGPSFSEDQFEFQCLHGMGEPLYEEVVGPRKLDRPARIYAPVGSHQTLLPYLVRRLLENGANTSFVNRVRDPKLSVEALIADPVAAARGLISIGLPHPKIALPQRLAERGRQNARGLDLADEPVLAELSAALRTASLVPYHAGPMLAVDAAPGPARPVRNPADRSDLVGTVVDASAAQIGSALSEACAAAASWRSTAAGQRAALLVAASHLFEQHHAVLLSLLVREGGKTVPNALSELREAVDFLRYYAGQSDFGTADAGPAPDGVALCISPWNFPLAIFTGQIAAALAAGHAVLAKPAEETPLIAAKAVRLLHQAGIPPAVLQLVTGAGETGARLVADQRVQAVMFTGSTEVAKAIQRRLAERTGGDGRPVILIAETGGQNAMLVDSSAHIEQVVADVMASSFDSAGQRCSALRVLYLQEEIAGPVLQRLRGAMAELDVGPPDRLSTDIGPVISEPARRLIESHVERLRGLGCPVFRLALPADAAQGNFVAPTVIEIGSLDVLPDEVFGPVLHVRRFRRGDLDRILAEINATGFGLTFGVHSRIEETIAHVEAQIDAGNVYVNRTMIGAVVGVQPFGGHGLSGTGPKAGGPLMLPRLMTVTPDPDRQAFAWTVPAARTAPAARAWCDWLIEQGWSDEAARVDGYIRRSKWGFAAELPGPVGESNLYRLEARGSVLCLPASRFGLLLQVGAALATGNLALVCPSPALQKLLGGLPAAFAERVTLIDAWADRRFDAVLLEGGNALLRTVARQIAAREGPITGIDCIDSATLAASHRDYCLDGLLRERSTSINTAAAGGNASLMTIG